MPEPQKIQDVPSYQRTIEEVSHFLDVPLNITIQLGRRSLKIREILHLKQNSIVELPKSAGENVEIYINGKLVAYGEVLEMEGTAGIRITDLYTSI